MQHAIPRTLTALAALVATLVLLPAMSRAAHHEAGESAAEEAPREISVAEAIEATAKVVEIDREERTVTIEGPNAGRVVIDVPAEAANFDAVKLGDEVALTYYESVALAIRSATDDAKPSAMAVSSVSLAAPGATPGGVIVETVERTAVVRAVDLETRTVTLDVPAGFLVALKVDESIDLANVKVGEKVVVTHTEALAIQIQKK